MRDQVSKLNSMGIAARSLHSEQKPAEYNHILREVREGKIKILYIAPERLENATWSTLVKELNLAMIVVDEAHCISVWGHDFRPAFRRIIDLVKTLSPRIPVMATTATATKMVKHDIALQMGGKVKIIRGKLMRDNLQLQVVPVTCQDEKLLWLAQHLKKIEGNGILYTGTRKNVDVFTNWLKQNNISCVGYHAGLTATERMKIERGLMENKWKCIVSTNALGMGIDKPDIRFIIHTQIPQSPIHYYQEIGRAGRDGNPGQVILLYHPEDVKLPRMFIQLAKPAAPLYLRFIELLEQDKMTEQELIRRLHTFDGAVRSIKADLMDQGIVREKRAGLKKYIEKIPGAPEHDLAVLDTLRELRLAELAQMVAYAETRTSRMQFLCRYLGDVAEAAFNNCDNSGIQPLTLTTDTALNVKLQKFTGKVNKPVATRINKDIDIDKIKRKVIDVTNLNPFD